MQLVESTRAILPARRRGIGNFRGKAPRVSPREPPSDSFAPFKDSKNAAQKRGGGPKGRPTRSVNLQLRILADVDDVARTGLDDYGLVVIACDVEVQARRAGQSLDFLGQRRVGFQGFA